MCTGIFIPTKNNEFIFGRTLEFGIPLTFIQICNHYLIGTIGHFNNYKNQYLLDGLNKYGLFVGVFFYPYMSSEYSKIYKNNYLNIVDGDLAYYILNNFKTINDLIQNLNTFNILQSTINNKDYSLHWIVCDKFGKCIVLEVKNKKLIYYNNPQNIITNSPSFPEHIQELKSYNFLSKYNKPNSISEGTGALGLPGDSSSESRFVRADFFRKNLLLPSDSSSGMNLIFNLLHNFDIPFGSVVNPLTKNIEVTQYTVAYSLNNFNMKYANYGYIQKNNKWQFTSTPVKKCMTFNIMENNFCFSIILILIFIILFKKIKIKN